MLSEFGNHADIGAKTLRKMAKSPCSSSRSRRHGWTATEPGSTAVALRRWFDGHGGAPPGSTRHGGERMRGAPGCCLRRHFGRHRSRDPRRGGSVPRPEALVGHELRRPHGHQRVDRLPLLIPPVPSVPISRNAGEIVPDGSKQP